MLSRQTDSDGVLHIRAWIALRVHNNRVLFRGKDHSTGYCRPCRFSYDRPRAGPTQCLTLLPHSADPGRHKGALIQIGIGEQPQYQGRQASR